MYTRTMLAAAAAVALAGRAAGHGAVTHPRPRNSIDADVAPWVNGVPMPVPFEPWCPFGDAGMAGKNPQNLTGANGQACFWFSNGCTIGCESCDGDTRGPIPKAKCPTPDEGKVMCGRKMPACKTGALYNATNCNPATRTVNTGAACGAADDYYYYSPWRAPGAAPVFDSCGLAGGRTSAQGDGGFGAQYVDTPNAKQGMAGSALAPLAPQATWRRGSTVEVAWALQANHGGGYQYRLCPANETLSEACFQRHPLDFVESHQAIVFPNGSRVGISGTFVRDGVLPVGSTWAMLPIPSTWLGPRCLGDGCESWEHTLVDGPCVPCPMTPGSDCSRCDNSPRPSFPPPVPGAVEASQVSILDAVVVPEDLPAGDYVLGFRYDCEATAQVWSNCADITLA